MTQDVKMEDARLKKALRFANQEAQRFNTEYVDDGHLLLGLVKEGGFTVADMDAVGVKMYSYRCLDFRELRLELEKVLQTGPEEANWMGKLPLTPRAKKVLEIAHKLSEEEGLVRDDRLVGTEHLLLAMLELKEGIASHVLLSQLENAGLSKREIRRDVESFISNSKEQAEVAMIGDAIAEMLDQMGFDPIKQAVIVEKLKEDTASVRCLIMLLLSPNSLRSVQERAESARELGHLCASEFMKMKKLQAPAEQVMLADFITSIKTARKSKELINAIGAFFGV